MAFLKEHDPKFDRTYDTVGKNDKWKNHIQRHVGQKFDYTVQGWSETHFQTSSVTLCLEVLEDGGISCFTCGNRFGVSSSTRSEYHAYKHAVAMHRPQRKTKFGANQSGEKRVRPLVESKISAFFQKKSAKTSNITSPSSNASLSKSTLSTGLPCNIRNKVNAVSPSPSCKISSAIMVHKPVASSAISTRSLLNSTKALEKPSYIRLLEKNGMAYNMCAGIRNDLPEPICFNFPMLIDSVIPKVSETKFFYDPPSKCLRAATCERWVLAGDETETADNFVDIRCQNCEDLSSDDTLRKIMDRATNDTIHQSKLNNGYLTWKQIILKLKLTQDNNDALRLTSLNMNKKVGRQCRALDLKQRMIVTVARGDVLRLHQIVNRCLNEKRGTAACLGMIEDALAGTYHPKGYSEPEILQQVLTFRFGGHRLMYAQNHSSLSGGASVRTVKRRMNIPRFITMTSDIEYKIILQNMENSIFNDEYITEVDKSAKCLWTLMIDDVKVEKRARVEEATDRFVGGCYHFHQEGVGTHLKCEDDFLQIQEALQDGRCHYASELTCVALAPNREKEYHPRVVATSAGCQDNDPKERTKKLVEFVCRIWEEHPKGKQARGILSTLQPDGAGTFVKIGQELFFEIEMEPRHPLYPHLSNLPLFCMLTGVGPRYERLTIGCEQKHVFKRTRERIKSQIGFTMFEYQWTGKTIEALLRDCGYSEQAVRKMFAKGYADAMNVPEMVKLYKAISDMSTKEPDKFQTKSGVVLGIQKELKFFGKYCKLIYEVLSEKLPLGTHLEHISCLMHINLVCYRRNGTGFLPGQNFTNQQRYHRSIFWSLANAIEEDVLEYFLFLDAGDRLEELYGLLRTLNGGASGTGDGMDALQAAERINSVMEIAKIFALYPDLQKASKHLKVTNDHQNPRSYLRDENGKEHREFVDVTKVNLRTKYYTGRRKASEFLKEVGFSDSEHDWDSMAKEKDVDMLRPKGKFVGMKVEDIEDDINEMGYESASSNENCEVIHMTDSVTFDEKLGGLPKEKDQKCLVPMGKVTLSTGEEMNKAKYLRMLLDEQHVTETSRVGRNQGKVKSGTAAVNKETTEYDSEEEMITASEDPIATLVLTKANGISGFALVIVSTEQFQRPGQKYKEIEIPHSEFLGELVVEGKFVPVRLSEQEAYWNIQQRSTVKMSFHAEDATVLNPEIRTRKEESSNEIITECFIDIETLQKVLDKLVLEYNSTESTKKRVLYDIGGKTPDAPYRNGSDFLLFKALSNSSNILSSTSNDVQRRSQNKEFTCSVPGCKKKFPCKDMRHHVAWHILHDSDIATKVQIELGELCGMCGINQTLPYHSGGTDIGCSAWIEKKRGSTKNFRYMCNSHEEININYKSALKSTTAAPSTNVPIECPLCSAEGGKGNEQHFFKYNFLHHWQKVHKGKEMKDDLLEHILITEQEKKNIMKFKDPKKPRKPKKKANARKGGHSIKRSLFNDNEDESNTATKVEKSTGIHGEQVARLEIGTTQLKATIERLNPAHASPLKSPTKKYQYLEDLKICMPVVPLGERYAAKAKDPNSKCELLKEISKEDAFAANSAISLSINMNKTSSKQESSDAPYGHGKCPVSYKSMATLEDGERIGDEIVNLALQVINDRNITGRGCFYSYIVNTYFVGGLVGLDEKRMTSNNIFFTGSMVDNNESSLKKYARKWLPYTSAPKNHRKEDKGDLPSVLDLVQKHGLKVLIFPVNITGYHWFFIAADMASCTVTVYDSCFTHHNSKRGDEHGRNHCDTKVEMDSYILDLIKETDYNDIPYQNLKDLCKQYKLETHGSKLDLLRRIMRPMFAQEIVRYLKWDSEKGSNVVNRRDWKIFISCDMPQQKNFSENCGLYTVAGADVVSDGGDVSSIDGEKLETQGRLLLAHLCTKNASN